MAREPRLSAREVQAFVEEVFPQQAGNYRVDAVGPMTATVSQAVDHRHLRPGGTISGGTLFHLADYAFYAVTLAMIGREAMTVTTTTTINFLRKPPAAGLRAEARILKLGRLLATGDVTIFSDGIDGPVAHATLTYAIPPAGGGSA